MKFYKNIYLEEGLKKKKEKIIENLENRKFQWSIYLIVLSSGEKNQLEILNSSYLLQPEYPGKELFVVGITKGYDAALEIVEEIVQEVYNKTKGTEIRPYILNKEQEK